MDPSPQNVEAATYNLGVDLYKAAVYGQIEAFNAYEGRLHCLVTPNRNTVLHVHLGTRRYGVMLLNMIILYYRVPSLITLRSTKFVEHLLNKCPSLLLQANANGEIPLHVEARYGHCPTVKLLLERERQATKEMLRKRDKEENTPLHNAARYGHLEVVRALIAADPDFVYPPNRSGETPLYIAARKGYHRLVAEMLECRSVPHAGPKGANALHAAVMANSEETVRTILDKKKILAKETDENDRSPLHFAAHLGYKSIVKALLECDESTAYIADLEGKMTALHMAARQGHASIMKDIIRHCPGCCELVDKRGWNFLHFAALTLYGFAQTQFLGDNIGIEYVSMENLLCQKDEHGNTPLQVLAIARPLYSHHASVFAYHKEELAQEYLTVEKEEQILNVMEEVGRGEVAGVPVRPLGVNRRDLTRFEKARDSQLVVAALIATVTFSAAITMPGGYKNDDKGPDQGTAILIRNAAFNLFVVFDAIALLSSVLAILFYFLMARPRSKKIDTYPFAYLSTLLAIGAMVIAFISGAFAVLEPSLGLAITTGFIGLSFSLVALAWHQEFALLDVCNFFG
ncbi:hypothetical protein DITRI_Ditri15bG0090200 [Diplodiscus trichospermus]